MTMLLCWIIVCLINLDVTSCQREDLDSFSNSRNKRQATEIPKLTGVTLSVGVLQIEPYVSKKTSPDCPLCQESGFYGIVPEILEKISEITDIKFDIRNGKDNKYGTMDDDGNWDGLIGELISDENSENDSTSKNTLDIAAVPMTRTSEREAVVDFLTAFTNEGRQIIYKKPSPEDPYLTEIMPVVFRLLKPFTMGLWAFIMFAFLGVSFSIWLMNKLNPYEWGGRYEIGNATKEEADKFNLIGSIWFVFTTSQWQGYDLAPKSYGSKLLAAFWLGFVSLTIVTYSGGIMNELFWSTTAHEKLSQVPFKDVHSLLVIPDQKVVMTLSVHHYFNQIKNKNLYPDLFEFGHNPAVNYIQVGSMSEGLKQVREEGAAFIIDSEAARYLINQEPCDLMTIGDIFARMSRGWAVNANMNKTIFNALSRALLKLNEGPEQILSTIEKKHFELAGACHRNDKFEKLKETIKNVDITSPKAISVKEFMGPVVSLIMGFLFSIFVTIAEIVYYKMKGRQFQHSKKLNLFDDVDDDDNDKGNEIIDVDYSIIHEV